MISPQELAGELAEVGVRLVTGVPDTTFKNLIPAFDEHPDLRHIITTTEGEAAAMAFGYRLATGSLTLTYLQNSGLGDVLDVLTSLADSKVYAVPLILMIGWRGRPGQIDEPQHRRMGELTEPFLQMVGIRYKVLTGETGLESIREACELVRSGITCALLVENGVFSGQLPEPAGSAFHLSREKAISIAINNAPSDAIFVSTVGGITRELYELRDKFAQSHISDLYIVGGMGSALAVAHGVALACPERRIIVLDGDGAALMGLGALATVGHEKSLNLLHILLDNGLHNSTGAQPTASSSVDFTALALACGYKTAVTATDEKELKEALRNVMTVSGASLAVVKVKPGARADLVRPKLNFAKHGMEFGNGIRS